MIGFTRHRIATDGDGVTTLITFHHCPLHCQYCLNPQCLVPHGVWRMMTVDEMVEQCLPDNLYYLASGGGVTFGGGEPLLRSEAIAEFCSKVPGGWRICVETSLNVDSRHLLRVLPSINHYYVDIKDMNPDIYRRYTERSNEQVMHNLSLLIEHGKADDVTVRVPHIPNYNTDADVHASIEKLKEMGFSQFDEFNYVIRPQKAKAIAEKETEPKNHT